MGFPAETVLYIISCSIRTKLCRLTIYYQPEVEKDPRVLSVATNTAPSIMDAVLPSARTYASEIAVIGVDVFRGGVDITDDDTARLLRPYAAILQLRFHDAGIPATISAFIDTRIVAVTIAVSIDEIHPHLSRIMALRSLVCCRVSIQPPLAYQPDLLYLAADDETLCTRSATPICTLRERQHVHLVQQTASGDTTYTTICRRGTHINERDYVSLLRVAEFVDTEMVRFLYDDTCPFEGKVSPPGSTSCAENGSMAMKCDEMVG